MKWRGSKKPSQKSQRGALAMLLCGCREEMLANFTAESLAKAYGLKVGEVEPMLEQIRKARA